MEAAAVLNDMLATELLAGTLGTVALFSDVLPEALFIAVCTAVLLVFLLMVALGEFATSTSL